jgi:hypothetical protein
VWAPAEQLPSAAVLAETDALATEALAGTATPIKGSANPAQAATIILIVAHYTT